MLLFRILDTISKSSIQNSSVANEAVNILHEVLGGKEEWHSSLGIDELTTSYIELKTGWTDCSIRNVLVGDVPIAIRERLPAEILADRSELPYSVIEGEWTSPSRLSFVWIAIH